MGSRHIEDEFGTVVAIRCRGCGKVKSLDEYHLDRRDKRAQRQTQCRSCSLDKLSMCRSRRAEGFKRFSFTLSPGRSEQLKRHADEEGTKAHILLREWVGAILDGRMWYL